MDTSFENEELNFKTLSSGLGFHQEVIKPPELPGKSKVKALKQNSHTHEYQAYKDSYRPDVFIEKEQSLTFQSLQKSKDEVVINEPLARDCSLTESLGSFLIDFVLVCFISGLITSAISFFVGVNNIATLMAATEVLGFFVWNTFLIFLFYSSFLDGSGKGTLGKLVFSLKVVGLEGKKPSLKMLFLRNFLTQISIPFLGFLSLLNLPGFLSETRLVKRV